MLTVYVYNLLQIASDDHIKSKNVSSVTKEQDIKSLEKRHKTICSIEINISTYFECSLLLFCFEVNSIPEIWSKPVIICISIRKSILPAFENVGARCRTKDQQ